MDVPLDLYKWLVACGVLTEYDIKATEASKVVLEQEAIQMFEIGLKMPPLLNRLQALKSLKDPETNMPLPGVENLKDSLTPAAKLFNWNVITKSLAVYGVNVEEDVKNLIIAGDLQMILDLLYQIRESEQRLARIGEESSGSKMKTIQPTGARGKGKKIGKKGAVDIASIDIYKENEDIESCLEFLLITLSRSFNLKPKQAAGLLTDSNKYLSHILVKGLKGDFGPVTAWLMEVYSASKYFSGLIKYEEDLNAVNMVFNALKGGLYSKNKDAAIWTIKILSKLAYDFQSLGLIRPAWEWFVSIDGGLDGVVYMIDKHLDVEEIALELLLNIGTGNIYELFTHYLKSMIKESLKYWRLTLSFIKPLSVSFSKLPAEDKRQVEQVVDYWLEASCGQADNDTRNNLKDRATALNLLSEIWYCFPSYVETKEEIANHVLTMLKRATRDRNSAIQIFSLAHLFKLLEVFAIKRNIFAPIIYKALTFSLIENHTSQDVREFIMNNLINIFTCCPSIPVGIVVEPLVKQIQLSENETYLYNLFDFQFIEYISRSPKLTQKSGVQLLDLLAKIVMNVPFFSPNAKIPFITLAQKFVGDPSILDFLIKFMKIVCFRVKKC